MAEPSAAAVAEAMFRGSHIPDMADALTWGSSRAVLEAVHLDYTNQLSDALGCVLAGVLHRAPTMGARLQEALGAADGDSIMRVLLAPDTSHRLLWRNPSTIEPAGEFLLDALAAESARLGGAVKPASQAAATVPRARQPLWSAQGDFAVLPDGEILRSEAIGGSLAIDLDSPNVSSTGPEGDNDPTEWTPLPAAGRSEVLERLERAYRGVCAVDPLFEEFLSTFVKVVMLQRSDKRIFFAFSCGQYVGRVTISNPELADEVILAEALVHEAIHSLLYMQDQRPMWGLTPGVYEEPGEVVSPWSGRTLPVTTFLHACFVWYGLLNFWGRAINAGAFPDQQVRHRTAQAASGFLGRPLLADLAGCGLDLIEEDVVASIEEMQRRVLRVCGER